MCGIELLDGDLWNTKWKTHHVTCTFSLINVGTANLYFIVISSNMSPFTLRLQLNHPIQHESKWRVNMKFGTNVCMFHRFEEINISQGGVLTTVGIVGTLLSGFTIYCLIFHVKLPYSQVMVNKPRICWVFKSVYSFFSSRTNSSGTF